MTTYEFLSRWYQKHCDGDWEHQYGVRISTIDNPGWEVQIDLAGTELEDININYHLVEKSDSDWYGYCIKERMYKAAGDPGKLEEILLKFKEIVEKNDAKK